MTVEIVIMKLLYEGVGERPLKPALCCKYLLKPKKIFFFKVAKRFRIKSVQRAQYLDVLFGCNVNEKLKMHTNFYVSIDRQCPKESKALLVEWVYPVALQFRKLESYCNTCCKEQCSSSNFIITIFLIGSKKLFQSIYERTGKRICMFPHLITSLSYKSVLHLEDVVNFMRKQLSRVLRAKLHQCYVIYKFHHPSIEVFNNSLSIEPTMILLTY